MKSKPIINGVINIDKPAHMTSHDVVDVIRRAANERQVGHTGTLDPMATGVLPICIGQATKIQQFLIAQNKEYVVDMQLGLVADTQDTTGKILEETEVKKFSEQDILNVLEDFKGELEQIPPMVSAKHHKGKRLYELARQGIEVKRDPCKIIIDQLILEDVSLPFIKFRVVCGKGTYIRTLCHDIGQILGCGAVMSGLVRTRCGSFHIDDSTPLNELKSKDDVEQKICSLNDALSVYPSIVIGQDGKAAVRCGRPLSGGSITRRNGEFVIGELVRITGRDGSLIGIGEAVMNSEQLDSLAGNMRVIKPVKIFQPTH